MTDRAALAEVIQLRAGRARTDAPAGPQVDPAVIPCGVDGEVTRDAELLRRRYGDRWAELPADMGRTVALLERLLVHGPTAVDPAHASPNDVVVQAWLVVRAAAGCAPALQEEAEVLGEALGADVAGMDPRQLLQLVGAVLDLGLVRTGDQSWADPSSAELARVVIAAHRDDLHAAAELHQDVYGRFTEAVWNVSETRLRAGRRPWRVVGRIRLRADLAAVSRTGKVPGSLADMSDLLLRARSARERLADLAPLLDRHLGRHHQGPLTDIAAAVASLEAVVRLQHLLGERLDVARLRGLLLADAFTTAELTTPALNLRSGLRAWQSEVARLCGGDPWSIPVSHLASWAARTGAALPDVTAVLSTMAELGQLPSTLRDLVDDLLLREHAADVGAALSKEPAGRVETGSAS